MQTIKHLPPQSEIFEDVNCVRQLDCAARELRRQRWDWIVNFLLGLAAGALGIIFIQLCSH